MKDDRELYRTGGIHFACVHSYDWFALLLIFWQESLNGMLMECFDPTIETRQVSTPITNFNSSISNEMWLTIGAQTNEITVKMVIRPQSDPSYILDSVGKVIQWKNFYVLTSKIVVYDSMAPIVAAI